jgi:hypothetical protein
MSSRHARPDTRALSSVGLFCNTIHAPSLLDVNQGKDNQSSLWNMTRALVEGAKDCGLGPAIELRGLKGLRVQAFPCTPVVASLPLSCVSSEPQFLLAHLGSSGLQQVSLGGVEYHVVASAKLPPWKMLER